MARIIGNTTATPTPRSDWNQNDATKADYIKNKPTILTEQDVKDILDEEGVVTSDDGSISVTGGIEANTITATSDLYTQYIGVGDTELRTDEISTTTVFADEFTTYDGEVVIDTAGIALNHGAGLDVADGMFQIDAYGNLAIHRETRITLGDATVYLDADSVDVHDVPLEVDALHARNKIKINDVEITYSEGNQNENDTINIGASLYVASNICAEEDIVGGNIEASFSMIASEVQATEALTLGNVEIKPSDDDSTVLLVNGTIRTADGVTSSGYIGAPEMYAGDDDQVYMGNHGIFVSGDGAQITLNGEQVALQSDVPTKTSQLTNDSNYLSANADALEVGSQVTALGEYSSAFNKGLIGTETKATISGYDINVNEILKKGVDIVAVDSINNTLDIYGTYEIKLGGIITLYTLTIADAFEYAMGANPRFIVEVAETNRLPVISSEKVDVNGKECARIRIHKAYSVGEVTTSQKITNFYAGYTDAEGAMVVNKLNIVLAIGGYSSGYNNLVVAENGHAQNASNIVSGAAGSAAGSLTEAGVTAFSTGHRTKALGESSLTFGIRSETAYTESSEVEGGKGSLAGGYNTRANAPYSAALGFETSSDRQGQLSCGEYSEPDAEAMLIVGAGKYGNPENAFVVKNNGTGYFKGDIYTNGAQVATMNDIPESPISMGAGAGAAFMGDRTSANADYSLAGGETSTTAEGAKACLAFGISAEAQKNGSAALGWRTKANCENQLVVGRCNNYENWGQALFVVGNGTSDSDRRNALVVNGNGNTYITGDAYSKNKQLATEEYVNNAIANIELPEGSSSDMGEWDYVIKDSTSISDDLQTLSGNVLVKGGSHFGETFNIGQNVKHLHFDGTSLRSATTQVIFQGHCEKISGINTDWFVEIGDGVTNEVENCEFGGCRLVNTEVNNVYVNHSTKTKTVAFRICSHMNNIKIAEGKTPTYTDCKYVNPFTCQGFGSGVPMIDGNGAVTFIESAEGGSYGS